MREQIDGWPARPNSASGEHQEVIETYKMFAYDEGWSRRINEAIDSGLTAEAAIERVQQRTRMRMRQIDDPLLADRMHDLEDLSNRLLRIVSGQLGTAAQLGLRQDTILIARNLGPAELLEYDKRRLKGVVLEEGSLTAHVVIVARAMGIPVLGRVRDVRHLVQRGRPHPARCDREPTVHRPRRTWMSFREQAPLGQKRKAKFAELREQPAMTKDGVRIELMVNAGLRDDVGALDVTGADGIGLFRTEFQFLVSATMPQRERQQRLYRDVLDAAGDKPVIFRTLDIGGDKALPYLHHDDDMVEENPAMGWRALRLSLERDGLMKAQARALLEAAAGRTLHVMFPMVSEPWEYDAARGLFEHQRQWLVERRKMLPTSIKYGAMLEVPALAEVLDILLPKLDFLSVGTNDLTQFLFAADRAHPKLAERYDWLSVAILRFLDRIVKACEAAQVPVGVCGEMGGRTLEAMALLGLGIRRLSITPASIGPVKAMIRSLELAPLRAAMQTMLAQGTREMRLELLGYAEQAAVELS
jgi:phosphotransferase system enzyme I (PtsP)